MNLVRFHGVLAPDAHARSAVVPVPPIDEDEVDDLPARRRRPPHYAWSKLLARVFAMDMEEVPLPR